MTPSHPAGPLRHCPPLWKHPRRPQVSPGPDYISQHAVRPPPSCVAAGGAAAVALLQPEPCGLRAPSPGASAANPATALGQGEGEGFLSQAAPCPGGAVKPRFCPARDPGSAPNDKLITDICVCMCTEPIFLLSVVTTTIFIYFFYYLFSTAHSTAVQNLVLLKTDVLFVFNALLDLGISCVTP